MDLIEEIRGLWDHCASSDSQLVAAVASGSLAAPEASREIAHVLGTEETWLARIEGRAASAAVWPQTTADELPALARDVHAAFDAFLSRLRGADLERAVTYTNSAGQTFSNTVGAILLHVVLHGQYHRGKINLLLRQAGREPSPVDYIAYLRGAPAATEATSLRGTMAEGTET